MKLIQFSILFFLHCASCAVDHQAINNAHGDLVFQVFNGSLLEIANQHRAQSSLKLFLHSVSIDKIEPKGSQNDSWILELSDKSTAEFHLKQVENGTTEYYLQWNGGGPNEKDREVCVHYGGDASWYSTYQELHPEWPLNTSRTHPPIHFNYINGFGYSSNNMEFMDILELLFLSTSGFALLPDHLQPLFLRRDPNGKDPLLCFSVKAAPPYFITTNETHYLDLKLHLFASTNIRTATNFVVHKSGLIPRPTTTPDPRMFRYPAFSNLWINTIRDIGTYIQSHNYSLPSQLGAIDLENYHHGTEDASLHRTVEELHKQGHLVTLKVYPWFKFSTFNHSAQIEQHLVKMTNGTISQWVDFSDPEAAQWYSELLNNSHVKHGVDSFLTEDFNFTASAHYQLHDKNFEHYPAQMITKYLESVSRVTPLGGVSFIGYRTQHLPTFLQLFSWDYNDKCLQSIIPSVLRLSIAGYSYISPHWCVSGYIEFQIRRLQVATFMPYFSVEEAPKDFWGGNFPKMIPHLNFRYEQSELMVKLAQKRVETGDPIVRPMWYVAPDDPKTYHIADQYMAGDDLLVAPILALKQTERQVYLPAGNWVDRHGKTYQGPTEIKVSAPVEELPYFTRKV